MLIKSPPTIEKKGKTEANIDRFENEDVDERLMVEKTHFSPLSRGLRLCRERIGCDMRECRDGT
jgi:hypothetical protein